MKILLDECVTKHLKPHLIDFDVYTVSEMKWNGIKNGKLISLCIENGFDLLLTIDKNIQFQQALEKHPLIIVIINSVTSNIDELITYLTSLRKQLGEFQKHNSYLINK
ncbi:MAG: DUF5615 family PIN-like protein [Saprospiraceae bacterium]